MEKLMIRFLVLSSLLFATNLTSVKAAGDCAALAQTISTATYTADINFYKKHISGLIIFKATDDTTKHVVFITETGFKFFDFQFTPNTFQIKYCLKSLNKKVVINTFKADFGYLLFAQAGKAEVLTENSSEKVFWYKGKSRNSTFYTTKNNCGELVKIERGGKKHKNLTIELDGLKQGNFYTVKIVHHNIKLDITLKQINK